MSAPRLLFVFFTLPVSSNPFTQFLPLEKIQWTMALPAFSGSPATLLFQHFFPLPRVKHKCFSTSERHTFTPSSCRTQDKEKVETGFFFRTAGHFSSSPLPRYIYFLSRTFDTSTTEELLSSYVCESEERSVKIVCRCRLQL